MTTISIPPDLERPLKEAAHRRGTTLEQIAVETLREHFASRRDESISTADTLGEFLEGYVGIIEGSSEAYSER